MRNNRNVSLEMARRLLSESFQMPRQLQPIFALSLLLSTSCAAPSEDVAPVETASESEAFLGSVGTPTSNVDVRAELTGSDNVISRWLASSDMTDDGRMTTNYLDALRGIADERVAEGRGGAECGFDSARTFTLSDDLFGGGAFPRLISTLCKNDKRAAEFFIAASFQHPNNALDPSDPNHRVDIDPTNLEMFAWDNDQDRYVFYAMLPIDGSDEVQVEVEPQRCEECHKTPPDLDSDFMPMTPVMNELTQPWPHWQAETKFPNHTFELPEALTRTPAPNEEDLAPAYREIIENANLTSVADFEQVVRRGQSHRVVTKRAKTRKNDATVEETMALVRPLFCAEQVNYVSEDHDSGFLSTDTIIAAGTRDAFLKLNPTWPWSWINDKKIRFAGPDDSETPEGGNEDEPVEPVDIDGLDEDVFAGEVILGGANTVIQEEPLQLLPVRGNVDVELQRKLLGLRAITPLDVLRIFALDWKRPTLSQFRCGLWRTARADFRNGDFAIEINTDDKNVDIIPDVIDGILKKAPSQLHNVEDGKIVALADATRPNEFVSVDPQGFGDLLQEWAETVEKDGRLSLWAARKERLCAVGQRFPNRPALPDVACLIQTMSAPKTTTSSPLPGGGLEGMDNLKGANNRDLTTQTIPDTDTLTTELEIKVDGDPIPVQFLRVRLGIIHPWRGDLSIKLQTPGGTTLDVVAFNPADSANNVSGDEFMVAIPAPMELKTGTWKLLVEDRTAGNEGSIQGWSLGVNQEAPSLTSSKARPKPAK